MNKYKEYGIYGIENTETKKIYIGKTINSFGDRWDSHKAALNGGYHSNRAPQEDWIRYGAGAFRFFIIVNCVNKETLSEVNKLEINEISKRRITGLLYNISDGGDTPLLGKHLSDDAKRKIGVKNKINMTGKKHSDETKARMSKSQKLRFSQLTEDERKEYGKIMSQRVKGHKWNEEQKKKLKNNKNGAKYTIETVKRIRHMYEEENISITNISKKLNIPRHTVYLIATYRRWKEI